MTRNISVNWGEHMQLADFEAKTLVELQRMAKDFGIDNYNRYRKRELIYELPQGSGDPGRKDLFPGCAGDFARKGMDF